MMLTKALLMFSARRAGASGLVDRRLGTPGGIPRPRVRARIEWGVRIARLKRFGRTGTSSFLRCQGEVKLESSTIAPGALEMA